LALVANQDRRQELSLIRLSDGRRTPLPSRGWIYDSAVFFPDNLRIAACARPADKPGAPSVIILHAIANGQPAVLPFSERVGNLRVSPKGDFVAAGRRRIAKWTHWDGRPEVVEPKIPANLIGFSPDGRSVVRAPETETGSTAGLYAIRAGGELDHEPLFQVGPADSKGVQRLNTLLLSPDGTAAAFVARRVHSELFLAEGLH